MPTEFNKDVVNVSDAVNINEKHAATDSDGGGIPNAVDNCPNMPNPGQAAVDHNGIDNGCDVRPSRNGGNGGSTATSPNSNSSSGGSRIVVSGGDGGGATSGITVLGGQRGGGSSVPSNSTPPPQVNHAPVANDKNVTTNEDASVLVTLTASDKDGNSLTYTISSIPKNGTLSTLDVDKISYTPNANFNGNDTFTFRAFDGQTYSNNATISIKVNPVNDNRISRVELTIDGNATAYQMATPKAAGDWSTWSINYNLPGGSHWFTARATDSLNRQAWYSITVVGASNSAPPTINITSPANNANLPSESVQFTGTTTTGGSPISKVELSIDGDVSSYQTATPKAAGDWSTWSIGYNVPVGSHYLVARVTDNAGKQAWSSITVVGSTTNAPLVIQITSPANNALVTAGTVTFGGTASSGAGVAKVELTIDGNATAYQTATPKAAGDWSTWSIGYNVPVGSHWLVAMVTDCAGKQAWHSITVVASASTAAPTAVQITSPANNALVTASTVTFSGTASSGAGVAKVELTIDGNLAGYQTATPKAAGDWSTWSIGYNVPVGSHTITARITDNAGKQQSNSITVVGSSAAPLVIQITSPANNAQVTAGTVTFSGTASSGAE